MSCLSVNINIIPSKFEVGTTLLNKLNVNITNISNGLIILLNKINEDLKLNISDIYQKHLTVSYGIVCSIKTENYLQVSPEDVQWITEDSDIIYIVKSNMNWKIITE
jgi:hypothetical protein